jgi:hypothetical protein
MRSQAYTTVTVQISSGLNYTTILNIVFLIIAAILVVRFLRTGGPAMLKMMAQPDHDMSEHGHDQHDMAEHDHGQHKINN